MEFSQGTLRSNVSGSTTASLAKLCRGKIAREKLRRMLHRNPQNRHELSLLVKPHRINYSGADLIWQLEVAKVALRSRALVPA